MKHFGLLCSIVYTFLNNVLKKISLFILEFLYWSLNQTCSLHLFTNHLFTSVNKLPLYICLQTTSLYQFTNHLFTYVYKPQSCSHLFTNYLFRSVYKSPVYICLQTTSLHQFTNHFIPLCFQPLYIFVYKLPLNICLQTICFKHLFTNHLFTSV